MSLKVERGPLFVADFENRFGWYVDRAGAATAWRFKEALDASLNKLSNWPELGRLRNFSHAKLFELRSCPLQRPFQKVLIFYRIEGDVLFAFRLMHSARDLPRRLIEPPGS